MADLAQGWPEADALFRRDPGWRGADAAYSVPLSGGRCLWLFGDTFVGASRRESHFVHNSVGIQDGPRPDRAGLTLHTGGSADAPAPFFPAEFPTWLWPMAGVRVPAGVLVFLMRVRSARPDLPTPLDAWRQEGSLRFFEVFDWTAALIRNPDDPVVDWQVDLLATPPAVNRIMPGAGVLADDDHVYAYGWRDGHELRPSRLLGRPRYRGYRRPRLAYLLRWPHERVVSGLDRPQWWCGTDWRTDADRATPVIVDPATEFTVHRDPVTGRFTLVETAGWLRGVDGRRTLAGLRVLKRMPSTSRALTAMRLLTVSVAVRTADAPQGPWSEPARVFTPRVARDVIVYAGKGHPHLECDGLACTYAQIAHTADRTLDDDSLYYPRFVRIPRELLSRA